jgi:hypothetical protein
MRGSSSNGIGTLRQYVPVGDADTNWVTATLGNGVVATFNIADFSITAVKMATNSIQNYAIVDGAVDSRALAFQSVTAGKIAPNAVSNANIAPSEIDGGRIRLNTISNANIYDYTIQAGKIGAGQLMEFHFTNLAGLPQIRGSNVIAAYSLTGTNMVNGGITNEQLASFAVDSNKIAALTINSSKFDTNLVAQLPVAWGSVSAAGALLRGIGCSVGLAASDYTVTFTTARSTTNYAVVATATDSANGRVCTVQLKSTGSFVIRVRNTATEVQATDTPWMFHVMD